MISVHDLSLTECLASKHDLALCASGYETRCISVPRILVKNEHVRDVEVLGFSNLQDHPQRRRHDKFYWDSWHKKPALLDQDEDAQVYELLHQKSEGADIFRVLVDYSSMSRIWYTALLNWLRYGHVKQAIVDCVYACGLYDKAPEAVVIDDILALPGLEGSGSRSRNTVAIFGLGFNGVMTQCVLEQLEPSTVYAYLASPGAKPEYERIVRERNSEIIKHASVVVATPLHAVGVTVGRLTELAVPHETKDDIAIVPSGPKPHVLAGVITAMLRQDVACLRVSTKRTRLEHAKDVRPSGDIIATRIIITP